MLRFITMLFLITCISVSCKNDSPASKANKPKVAANKTGNKTASKSLKNKFNKKPNNQAKKAQLSYWDQNQKAIGYTDTQKAQLKTIEKKYAAKKIWQIKDAAQKKKVRQEREKEYKAVLGPKLFAKKRAIDAALTKKNKKKVG